MNNTKYVRYAFFAVMLGTSQSTLPMVELTPEQISYELIAQNSKLTEEEMNDAFKQCLQDDGLYGNRSNLFLECNKENPIEEVFMFRDMGGNEPSSINLHFRSGYGVERIKIWCDRHRENFVDYVVFEGEEEKHPLHSEILSQKIEKLGSEYAERYPYEFHKGNCGKEGLLSRFFSGSSSS